MRRELLRWPRFICLLAARPAIARREGLALPIPVTLRFEGVASTEESRWQELVIAHLGLQQWERIALGDELELLGPVAQSVLRTHGVLWPPNAYLHVPILETARGGSVLTGWDGDGLLGSWRWARAQTVLHRRAWPVPRDVLRVGLALSPAAVRRRVMRTSVLGMVPWLRVNVRGELAEMVRADAANAPRSWDEWLGYYQLRRYVRLGVASLDLLGRARDVSVSHPFLDPHFLTALARGGAGAGYGDRDRAMRVLFGDLLPAEVIARRGKAEFGGVLWGERSRVFAASWAGDGIDRERVDPGRLAHEWTLSRPRFGAGTLLQFAWLAAQEK